MAGKTQVARRERLHRVCKSIIDNPRNVDAGTVAAFRSAALRFVHTQYDDETEGLQALYRDDGELGSSLRKAVEVIDEADRAADIAKADSSGPQSLSAALLGHLHDALDRKRQRHGFQKSAKEEPMDTVHSIMKDCGGPVAFAKTICDTGRSYGVSESEYVEAASRHAGELYGLPSDRAFAKLCESDGSVMRACGVLKAAEFSVFDIKPVVVGGGAAVAEAINNTERSAVLRAHEENVRIGREKFPFLSADAQFAHVFEDSKYAALAAQAHQRPTAPAGGVYAFPTAVAKSDHDFGAPNTDTAYATLMAKAEQLRSERPELSIAQCFDRIYTNRGNVELAKRERMESAPR
jgi:hypothetical protein